MNVSKRDEYSQAHDVSMSDCVCPVGRFRGSVLLPSQSPPATIFAKDQPARVVVAVAALMVKTTTMIQRQDNML